ncbi:MAG: LURP-one-related/scramblase family protein [Opitutales bacterium]
MKRYRLKEKFWTWGDHFEIFDESENVAFTVKGKAFSWGTDLELQDAQGRALARIKQKMMSFKPRFEIYIGDTLYAEVTKEFSWFKKKFFLDVPGPNDYEIEGSFWDRDYAFTRKGRHVCTVSRKLFSLAGSYGVEVIDGEDEVAILSTVLVIDQVLEDERQSSTMNFG